MIKRNGPGLFVRMLSSAVIIQALLSAGSLGVGLILIRNATNAQYGYYVLVINALLLVTSLQSNFISVPMVHRMTRFDRLGRGDLIGGLLREQRQLVPMVGGAAFFVTLLLCVTGVLTLYTTLLVLAAIAAAFAALYREFFRMVLLAYRQPREVLPVDFLYVLMLVCGALLATLTRAPAVITVLVMCVAAATAGILLATRLWRHERWNIRGAPGILLQMVPVGGWTVAGTAIHWTFSQGYNYLIVGTLDVNAVAAAAATRIFMMPVNMLSTGISSLMMPTASGWLLKHGTRTVFKRLALLAAGLAVLSLCYLGGVWICRDWLFTNILHKQFEQRDLLLKLWSVVFILMIFRDQLLYLLLARTRYRMLTGLTFCSAVLSLAVSYACLTRIGVAGALVGIMAGEILSVIGLVVMGFIEIHRDAAAPSTQPT
ncbi:MAG: capsular biosynthesis protein [Gammaproteobacteria bacterium]